MVRYNICLLALGLVGPNGAFASRCKPRASESSTVLSSSLTASSSIPSLTSTSTVTSWAESTTATLSTMTESPASTTSASGTFSSASTTEQSATSEVSILPTTTTESATSATLSTDSLTVSSSTTESSTASTVSSTTASATPTAPVVFQMVSRDAGTSGRYLQENLNDRATFGGPGPILSLYIDGGTGHLRVSDSDQSLCASYTPDDNTEQAALVNLCVIEGGYDRFLTCSGDPAAGQLSCTAPLCLGHNPEDGVVDCVPGATWGEFSANFYGNGELEIGQTGARYRRKLQYDLVVVS